MNFESYLVVDLEATCSDTGAVPRAEMEIIEVGAVMVDARSFVPLSEFQSFIRPMRHPKLTPFCMKLTSISQTDVDSAPDFKTFVTAFKDWLYRHSGFAFCSWGDYDRKQLAQDASFHRVANPISAPHINLKKAFTEHHRFNKKPGLHEAINLAGLQFEGSHHRGIDDARNIARLLPFIYGGRGLSSS